MFLRILRITVHSLCTIFAMVVLGISAYLLSISNDVFRWPSHAFASLAIATSAITIVSLPIVILLTIKQTSDFAVIAELLWLFPVWVLWLSTAANTARFNRDWIDGSCGFFNSFANATCREIKTVEAFAFIIWVILLVYWLILFGFAIKACATESRRKREAPVAPAGGQPQSQQGAAAAPMQQYQGEQPVQAPMNA